MVEDLRLEAAGAGSLAADPLVVAVEVSAFDATFIECEALVGDFAGEPEVAATEYCCVDDDAQLPLPLGLIRSLTTGWAGKRRGA